VTGIDPANGQHHHLHGGWYAGRLPGQQLLEPGYAGPLRPRSACRMGVTRCATRPRRMRQHLDLRVPTDGRRPGAAGSVPATSSRKCPWALNGEALINASTFDDGSEIRRALQRLHGAGVRGRQDQTDVHAPAHVTVSCENFDPSLWAYGLPRLHDNCCIDTITDTNNYGLFDTVCNKGHDHADVPRLRLRRPIEHSARSASFVNYEQDYFVKLPERRDRNGMRRHGQLRRADLLR
jgi:hypothetical protein